MTAADIDGQWCMLPTAAHIFNTIHCIAGEPITVTNEQADETPQVRIILRWPWFLCMRSWRLGSMRGCTRDMYTAAAPWGILKRVELK